eukprot:NODE_128_length_17019_cov_0.764480.p3 type:complete len:573 gc:universal NODE_128_length_17019_cov_0.764480:2401-683(-)
MIFSKIFNQAPKLIEIFVNNKTVKCTPGMPLIEAIALANIEIPRFCYHEKLNIAGNCRMCLVEVEKVPKPIASCAYPVMPNMKVFTDSPKVKQAREGVMEFLLANHPLDCPICDQGGECDLQDQSMSFGNDKSRFSSEIKGEALGGNKRAVEDKNLGPIVKTSMNRCIHCTRCVRFANDIAGAVELGTSGRGNDIQIGTYVDKMIPSELSGNIVDLCPVGALTAKPYAFKARPWELTKTESVDVFDACGSFIRIDTRGNDVMRVLPRINDEINEEWISDKTRHAIDGLSVQRLSVPMVRNNEEFVPITWQQAFNIFQEQVAKAGNKIAGVVGSLADTESIVALKDLVHNLDGRIWLDFNLKNKAAVCDLTVRHSYSFNTSINNLEDSDLILLIGTNPRTEAAILNIRIRKAYLKGADIFLNGPKYDLNYGYSYAGNGTKSLSELLNDKLFIEKLKKSKKPVVICGNGVSGSNATLKFIDSLKKINEKTVFNNLSVSIGNSSFYELGISDPVDITPKLVYLLNSDESQEVPEDAFVIYQGHHGDYGASIANLILPVLIVNLGFCIYRKVKHIC